MQFQYNAVIDELVLFLSVHMCSMYYVLYVYSMADHTLCKEEGSACWKGI